MTDTESIDYVLVNVVGQTGATGIQRQYDVFCTDRRMVFAVVASGWKMAGRAATAGGLGAGLGAIGGVVAGASINKSVQKNQRIRDQFDGLTLDQIAKLNDKSFVVPYNDIVKVEVKKSLLGLGRMNLWFAEGKFQCEFSKDQLEAAQEMVRLRLAARTVE